MKSEDFDPPFSHITTYYDRLMSFVNYPSWVAYIEKILIANRIPDRDIFDLGCGTGVCLELWLKKGYRVAGLDGSVEMVRICRERLVPFRDPAETPIWIADMRNFSLPQSVPVVTSLYDTLNYLLVEADLAACYRAVYENLRSGGIFIFDMNTTHALRDEWGNNVFRRRDENIFSVWDNTFDPTTNISTLRITLEVNEDDRPVTMREIHRERAYPLTTIQGLLLRAGFQANLYRHLTFQPASESDVRIMAVARKP
jgi:SAM-dependent methyltransferase